MLQLIDLHVSVYALKKGLSNIELFKPESFIAKYGIKPSQFLDLKSLKGDSSDNIPGVPGIGEKGAIDLLKQYGTLDEIYENIELIKDSMRKKLVAGKDSAYMSKKLADIWTDAPVKLDLKKLDVSASEPQKITEMLKKLEFRNLAKQFPDSLDKDGPETAKVKKTDIRTAKTKLIASDKDLQQMAIPDSKDLLLSVTVDKDDKLDKVLLGFDKENIELDVRNLKLTSVKNYLSSLFVVHPVVIGYDLKTSFKRLLAVDIDIPDVKHDVLIGSFLLNSLIRDNSLSQLADSELNIHLDESVTGRAEMLAVIRALAEKQAKQIVEIPKFVSLAKAVDWPIIPVLARMESYGIKLDTKYLKLMSAQVDDMIVDLTEQIYGLADREFNIASPGQLSEVLFTDLKLPTTGIKKGKTGYSTAASELEKLRPYHEIIDMISQYREVSKLKNTYIDTLPTMVDENSRLHTDFKLTIAQTGRLSSTDPNLQNIPVKTELGRRVRTAFVASEGYTFVSADYSQFELRLAAVLAGDEQMIDAFNRDVDIHTLTASQVYDRSPDDVTKTMRREAKVVNFGIMYGLSTHGLVAATGMSYEQAKNFINKYFETRPKLKQYIEKVREDAKKDGYVETLLGRRRPTPDVKSSNFMVREAAMRAAVNMPFQGSAADIMKKAMVDISKKIGKNSKIKMLLQIHDSILVECPEEDAKETAKLLKDVMEAAHKLPVKLTVDTVHGDNWGEL
jgi:DNA polymerase-1